MLPLHLISYLSYGLLWTVDLGLWSALPLKYKLAQLPTPPEDVDGPRTVDVVLFPVSPLLVRKPSCCVSRSISASPFLMTKEE